MNRRKVAIVGRGATCQAAPFSNTEWEIWGLPWISYPRVSRFIEIHEETFYAGPDEERDRYVAQNVERWPDVPFYCADSRAHAFKKPVPYPFRGVMDCLPIPFLEDSVAHMIALAIYEKVDEIGLWGVHMMGAYQSHRPSVTYLIGLAQGRGITVTVAPGSPLFMSLYVQGRYGITDERRY
jgi:hypothetical protein